MFDMRLRNVPGSREMVADSPWCVIQPEPNRGQWRSLFNVSGTGDRPPLHLEIGTGKGRFILEQAASHPDILYLGAEKYSSVLCKAVAMQNKAMHPNLRLVRMEAEILTEVFAPGEVDYIYLNFSDPWPKARHADRRLPSGRFLHLYDEILSPSGQIAFKTDNEALFDFALEEVERTGWRIVRMTRDLHHDPAASEGNVMTEYEERFSSQGHPIYQYIIQR